MSEALKQTSADERDKRVLELWERLVEVGQRLIPTGLHVFGRAANADECADLLRAVASFDRPERGARALTDLVSEGLGFGTYDSLIEDKTEEGWRMRARVEELTRESIELFMREGVEVACGFLDGAARVPFSETAKVFALLADVREKLSTSAE